MNLQQLEYFQDIARTQNMTKSAERLHVSQPALSSTLKALETELGIPLFDRKGRALVLNRTGQEFLKNVNSIFDILNRSRQSAALGSAEDWTEIVIGALGADTALIPFIDAFQQSHPHVRFRIISRKIISDQNAGDTVDFIISTNPEEHRGRKTAPIGPASMMVVLPKSDPLAQQPSISLIQLKDYPFGFCTPPSAAMPRTYYLCEKAGFKPNVAFTSDERLPLFMVLMQGHCVGILPATDALALQEWCPTLAALPIQDDCSSISETRYISWASLDALSPAAREFLDFVTKDSRIP